MFIRHATVALLFVAMTSTALVAQTKPGEMRTYETKDYVIHTDLGRDGAREADVRMTHMADEYRRRTRDFAGKLQGKLPFYLFKSEDAYHAAGGGPNSAGQYDPNHHTLMAFTGGEQANLATWYTVQHEGFHQFADQVIGQGLPIAINEGLAEYFGEALFTGDSFVTGVIPPWRLKRVKESIAGDKFMPLREIMSLSHDAWNRRLNTTNYDEVWSLVHYLVHAEDGARRDALATFIRDTSTGRPWDAEWPHDFGEVDAFEKKWRAWWTDLPDDPTADLYAEATLRTLSSFLARATARRQKFDTIDAFAAAAAKGELRLHESEWLPQSILNDALTRAAALRKAGGEYSLLPDAPHPPRILYVTKDGKKMVGRFTIKGSRVEDVTVER